MKNKIGLLYLSLYNHLSSKFGFNIPIHKRELFCRLGRHYLLPKGHRPVVLREMEAIGFLQSVRRNYVILLNKKIDEETLHDYCIGEMK